MYMKKIKKISQSCPTLCNPMDCSLPGSSIHGIPQARVLEWVAIASSSNPYHLLEESDSLSEESDSLSEASD